MSTFNYLYKKRLPSSIIAVAAIAGVTLSALPFSFAQAANDQSPVKDIVHSFFQWRTHSDNSSSSVWDLLPPGIAKKIFDHYQMPGVGNDQTDPEISNIETDFEDDEVMISWQTNERTSGTVYVSEDPSVDKEDADTLTFSSWRQSTNHMVTTDDLDTDTTYYAVIKATDKAGNETLSDEFSFTTQEEENTDEEAPRISNLNTDSNDDSLTVTWDTDEDANSVLYLSTTTPVMPTAAGTIKIQDATHDTDHELTASDLEVDTTYYGIVTSTDEDGNTATSSQFTFTTDRDTDDPVISNLTWDASTTSVTFTWDTDEEATSAVYTATTSGFALDDVGVEVDSNATRTTSHEITVTGLDADTTYYHRIVSVDQYGNETISSQRTTHTD